MSDSEVEVDQIEVEVEVGAMEPSSAPAAAAAATPRPRITNACEACRAAKVKCQASGQLGTCKRCLESKRECIFKTGPRTRRPRQTKRPETTGNPPPAQSPLPPAPGPSKTFTIDIPMPLLDDVTHTFEELRLHHEGFLDGLGGSEPSDSDDDFLDQNQYQNQDRDLPMMARGKRGQGSTADSVVSGDSLSLGASALSTPPSSVVPSGQGRSSSSSVRTMSAHLGLRPQFNLDSAGKLLTTFREMMLPHFPCIVLDEKLAVADMARERPFVLLAGLAAASSSRTLQGHSLYDEEFRKILGLKFVAGGERSRELLEGLVVYVAWYPFHLRPKNKQAFQYVRMAIDIINDLEIDQDEDDLDGDLSAERLGLIRMYLATYFIASHYATSWNRPSAMPYTYFTAKSVDLFIAQQENLGDAVLGWKLRLQRLSEETHELRRTRRTGGGGQTEYQTELMIKGIESQIAEWEARMPAAIGTNPSIRISLLFARVFIIGAPLLKLPSSKMQKPSADFGPFRTDPARLLSVIPHLHGMLDYFASLPASKINAFAGADWGSLILSVVLGYRLSFPLPGCPEWDDTAARRQVRFGEHLEKLCRMGGDRDGDEICATLVPGGSHGALDVMSASKVVLEILRRKYNKRVRRLEQPKQQQPQGIMAAMWAAAMGSSIPQQPQQPLPMDMDTSPGCPMLDGSLESYYPYWDETFAANHLAVSQGGGGGAGMAPAEGLGANNNNTGRQGQQQPQQAAYPDLWATISMDWAQQDGVNFENMQNM